MSILSLEFLAFTAAVILLYYLLPLKIRPLALLLASSVFAALSGWQTAVHLADIGLVTWGGALLLQKHKSRLLLFLLLAAEIGAMAFLKYYPAISGLEMAMPLGLSYFTFQSAGYLIDVYRGKAQAVKNPLRTLLFAGYFLQLPQGPISTWKELEGQLSRGHRLEPMNMTAGFQLLLWGFFKKLVIADRLAPTTEALLSGESLPGWFVLGGVILYTLRLYADFSGGLDIVRGISRMLGITLPENFRRPFFSQTVSEYWRRWHITLGAWFRSYVMTPLSTCRGAAALSRSAGRILGKKTGRALPTALATLLVFLMIGVWHMASWNAVVYGGYFGLIMAAALLLDPLFKTVSRALSLPKGGWMKPVRMIRTWGLILLAQYFAFTNSPDQGFSLLTGTFASWDFSGFAQRVTAVMSPLEWGIAGGALLILLTVDILCEHVRGLNDRLAGGSLLVRWPLLILLIVIIAVFGCYGVGYDAAAFVYTKF